MKLIEQGIPLNKCANTKCGNVFESEHWDQIYCDNCRKNRHGARKHRRDKHELKFVGLDGEGVLRPDGTHEYILLSVGNQSLYRPKGEALEFQTIMEYLWDCFLSNESDIVYVGFYLGYDFTNWLKDLPEERARMLLTKDGIAKRQRKNSGQNHIPFPVRYQGWEFDMLGMKRFKLRAEGAESWMYINDTGAFFQTSLLNVINPKNWGNSPIVTDEEFEIILKGKEERGAIVDYGMPVSEEMIQYNILENDILARIMDRQNQGFVNIGISLDRKQWFGPGQAAQEWMNNVDVPTREDHQNIEQSILESGRASYYGGWFEIFGHGHIPGQSYIYDINSAYPYIMSQLPCLLHGKWETFKNDYNNWSFDWDEHNLVLVYGTIEGSNRWIGAAPHRTKQGRILRPLRTKGWYWWHELQVAIQAGLIDNLDIEVVITYDPCNCESPFNGLAELYKDRIRLGKNTAEGKARKLVYNSAYGKCAQSIGIAKYANPIYASLITAGCRTLILDAIRMHPNGANDVLMVATDGIAFKTQHPNLEFSEDELGKWSQTISENLTLFMPGMYWDDSTREKLSLGKDPSLKSRGVSGKALSQQIKDIDSLFHTYHFPTTDLFINFSMVSPIQALARNKWHTAGLVSLDEIRHIDSNPEQKRYPHKLLKDRGIRRTIPYEEGPELKSTPYDKRFGMEMIELQALEGMTPDGDIIMLFAEALGLR